jgi:hypothetical protein
MAADETLWAVHVGASDEYLAMPDFLTAANRAAWLGDLDEQNSNPASPLLNACAVRWPYSAQAHAANMARQEGEPW